jgi:hypothetical protein
MSTKAEKRIAAAKRTMNDAAMDAAICLANKFTDANPDVLTSDPRTQLEHYAPAIMEAMTAVAAKAAGFDSYAELKKFRAES